MINHRDELALIILDKLKEPDAKLDLVLLTALGQSHGCRSKCTLMLAQPMFCDFCLCPLIFHEWQ